MKKLTEGQPDFVSSTDFLQFAKQEEKAGAPSPSSRAHSTIACVFCLHAFTRWDKSQSISELWVKARKTSSFTSFTGFAFIDNRLIDKELSSSVKAVKAKNKVLHVVTRAYAREERENRDRAGKIYLRDKLNYLRGRKNYL